MSQQEANMCTSGWKHENLQIGGSEYVESD